MSNISNDEDECFKIGIAESKCGEFVALIDSGGAAYLDYMQLISLITDLSDIASKLLMFNSDLKSKEIH